MQGRQRAIVSKTTQTFDAGSDAGTGASIGAAGTAAQQSRRRPAKAPQQPGRVAFVGSGPGDPDLLTIRAVELIRSAEVVVTESAEHAALVAQVRSQQGTAAAATDDPAVELLDGGFGTDGQPLTHAGRAKVVVAAARSGRRVVRLMVGDPFVHGSGPEEAQACLKAGIRFEIVPGISSVTAVPAYAGIPLTTRSVLELAVVSCGDGAVDWQRYSDRKSTRLNSSHAN